METTRAGKFVRLPQTRLGWWAVGLSVLFVLLFIAVTSEFLRFPGMLTMAIGVTGGILALIAILWRRERSWLLWLILLPGLFAILFSLGELLYPH